MARFARLHQVKLSALTTPENPRVTSGDVMWVNLDTIAFLGAGPVQRVDGKDHAALSFPGEESLVNVYETPEEILALAGANDGTMQ